MLHDEDVGLSYAQQRWYDSKTGRFMSLDSVGANAYLMRPNGLNPHSYAAGNPMRYVDPDGRCFFNDDVGQCFKDSWSELKQDLGIEPKPDPFASKSVMLPSKSKDSAVSLLDFDSPEQAHRRFETNWYAYLRAEGPTSGDAYDIYRWGQEQAAARQVETTMRVTEDVSRAYLKHVAVPYLVGEATFGVARFGGGALARGLAEDLAVTPALARVKQAERLESFYEASRGAAAGKRAEFGGVDMAAMGEARSPASQVTGEELVSVFHGTTRSTAWKIKKAGFRPARDGLFLAEDTGTGLFFGKQAVYNRGARSGTLIELRMKKSTLERLSVRERIGQRRAVRGYFDDVETTTGFERVLDPRQTAELNKAIQEGEVELNFTRFER
jgi:RHS repeat-associated protein